MSDLLTYSLKHPVAFTATRTVKDLSFRADLTIGEIKRLSIAPGKISETIMLLADFLNEPPELIEDLRHDDFIGLVNFFAPKRVLKSSSLVAALFST